MLSDAWKKVSSETIANCFKHAGWKVSDEPQAAEHPTFPAPDNMTEEEWQSFIAMDDHLDTVGDLDDTEISKAIKKRRLDPEAIENKSDNEDDDDEPSPITKRHVNDALQTLRSYLQINGLEDARLQLQTIDDAICEDFKSRQTQTSIINYLKPGSPC